MIQDKGYKRMIIIPLMKGNTQLWGRSQKSYHWYEVSDVKSTDLIKAALIFP